MTRLYNRYNRSITLGQQIGRGGEATVYAVRSNSWTEFIWASIIMQKFVDSSENKECKSILLLLAIAEAIALLFNSHKL